MKCNANICEYDYTGVCESFQYGDPLEPIVYIICQSMPVDKIFLLGTYPANPEVLGVEYDLLVLINTEDKRPMHEYESLIMNRCHDHAMITASVFKSSIIGNLLKEGNIFFNQLCNSKNLIFDDGRNKFKVLTSSCQCPTFDQIKKEFVALLTKARSFLSGAISYKLAGDLQLAAFMLHQTIEHDLNALLYPLTGYRIQTHNLNKLLVYARRFSSRFCEIFPKDSDREIHIYQTLHRAYICGRYKIDFQVNEETIQVLIQRATKLLELTEILFYQKLNELALDKMILFKPD